MAKPTPDDNLSKKDVRLRENSPQIMPVSQVHVENQFQEMAYLFRPIGFLTMGPKFDEDQALSVARKCGKSALFLGLLQDSKKDPSRS